MLTVDRHIILCTHKTMVIGENNIHYMQISDYYFLNWTALRYRASASCHVGSGLNPFATSLLLSSLLLKGLAALLRPYSAVVTGTTFVV